MILLSAYTPDNPKATTMRSTIPLLFALSLVFLSSTGCTNEVYCSPGFMLDGSGNCLSVDLSGEYPILINPSNNQWVNGVYSEHFSWETIDYTTAYILQISLDEESMDNLVVDEEVYANEVIVDFAERGDYYWRVRATNDTSESDWSAVWKYMADSL